MRVEEGGWRCVSIGKRARRGARCLRGGRVLQHGDHHLERLQARDRVAVADGPRVARRPVRLEHERRLVAAAEAHLHLAAGHELHDALQDEEVLRLARLVQREHRVRDLLRPVLRRRAVALHARHDEVEVHLRRGATRVNLPTGRLRARGDRASCGAGSTLSAGARSAPLAAARAQRGRARAAPRPSSCRAGRARRRRA